MAADAHKNFAYSTVATAPSPANSGTSLVVQAATGTVFPTPPFNATVWPAGAQPTNANAEIVRVTAISTDTLTITRTQEGSSARTIVAGDQIAAGITAKTLTDAENSSGMQRELGSYRVNQGGAVIPTSYATYGTVTATSKGGKCKMYVWAYISNGGSGATRNFNMQATCDGTVMNTTPQTITSIYASAEYPHMLFAWVFDSTPAAGSHTWNFQVAAGVASALVINDVYTEVIETLA